MKSVKCSQCGLVNFANAVVCKRCNQQFQNSSQSTNQTYNSFGHTVPNNSYSYSNSNQGETKSNVDSSIYLKKMIFGTLWAIGGTVATVIGYNSASGGGKYMIFWGAILFGAVDFCIGLNGYIGKKN